MEGFTFTTVIVGIICYGLGMIFGWYTNRMNNQAKVNEAYRRGEETATRAHENEKRILSEELLERLGQMKQSLISTYEAYEDALLTVDQKLSPGTQQRLSLGMGSAQERSAIEFHEEKPDLKKKVTEVLKTDANEGSQRGMEGAERSTQELAQENGALQHQSLS